jgi:protein-tyrosine phosphatase
MNQSVNPSEPRQRYIPLEGSYNIRDIGGYATLDGHSTRWGTLLRADSPNNLPLASQRVLLDYPIHTIIDLRRSLELQRSPNIFAQSPSVKYVNISLLEDENKVMQVQSLEALYLLMLDTAQEQIKLVIETMAQEDAFPCLVHCAIGKDRTGLITALVLSLSNVPATTIADDYALSEQYLDPLFKALRPKTEQREEDLERLAWLIRSRKETMLATLSYLEEKYGDVRSYLSTLGISNQQMNAIHSRLVEL